MLFNSYTFVLGFLPLVWLGFALVVARRARALAMVFVAVASLVFYAWSDWRYALLILSSILFNYACGAVLGSSIVRRHPRLSRVALGAAVAMNLGLLGYFKYTNFLLDTLDRVLGSHWQVEHITLPLALSFFTFEQITYLVDAYRGTASEHEFLGYAFFITFFPRLIAGPIVRPGQLLPQLRRPSTFEFSAANVGTGLVTFAVGLFKKVIIADTFAPWVEPIFDRAPTVSFSDAWGASLAFALQLYFDFSAYSDMAIGLALLFNIRLPENFDSPYQARSIIDFWRRWHMTLSSFLRDYLYIPLGGNRTGPVRRYLNLFVTMLLGGLWHGANWTFVMWGGLHGVYVAINHLWRRTGIELPGRISWVLTFLAVLVGWVFFRATSFERAGVVLAGMAGLNGFASDGAEYSIGAHQVKRLVAGLALVLWCPNRRSVLEWQWGSDSLYAVVFALLMGLSILQLGDPSPFLYFRF